jgi:hypothetical protein
MAEFFFAPSQLDPLTAPVFTTHLLLMIFNDIHSLLSIYHHSFILFIVACTLHENEYS